MSQLAEKNDCSIQSFELNKPALEGSKHGVSLMRSIFDSLPNGVVVLDGNGCVQACNRVAKSLFGGDFFGEQWSSVIHRAFAPEVESGACIRLRDGRLLTLVTCPLSLKSGQILLFTDITETHSQEDKVKVLPSSVTVDESSEMVIVDRASHELLGLAKRVAMTDVTVLISGESGVGKEVMARYIHQHSKCAEGPFVAINCAAIPENMLEATLFGYEKGAFTGAYQSSPGKFEQAQNGTLLLDEISEMALELQAKLLRVLQEREVERLGGRKTIALNVRVLTTSNRDMKSEVAAGRFREDLFFRLNVFPLLLLPLRKRTDDILPLAQKMLKNLAESNGDAIPVFTKQAERLLLKHHWPGNVRELSNVLQRAMILKDSEAIKINAGDLQIESSEMIASSDDVDDSKKLNKNLEFHEHDLIIDALKGAMGDRAVVAKKLGISPRTLRYKLAKMRERGMAV